MIDTWNFINAQKGDTLMIYPVPNPHGWYVRLIAPGEYSVLDRTGRLLAKHPYLSTAVLTILMET